MSDTSAQGPSTAGPSPGDDGPHRQDGGIWRRFGALGERDFRNLYFGRAFSLFGDGLVPVALAFAVLETENSASALGLVLASRAVSLVGFLLFAGVIADRIPRRRLLIGSDLLRLATQALMAALLLSRTAELWQLALLTFVYGLGDAFFRPASTGIIPEVVSAGRLQQGNALIALTQHTCTILGPVAAGFIVVLLSPGWAFVIDAMTFAVSAVFVARLPMVRKTVRHGSAFLADLRAGWREFRSRAWLYIDGIFSALASFAVLAPFLTLGPVVANNALGGAAAWSAILAAFGAGSVLGGITLLKVRPARPLLVALLALTMLALPAALLAIPASVPAIAVAAFAGGTGLAIFNTLFETTVQQNIPEHMLSRVASIDWMLSSSLMPLGMALAGPAAALVGARGVFIFSVVWLLGSTAAVLSVAEIRRFGQPAQSAVSR